MYLNRVVDSFIKEDLPKGNEERLREQILQNQEELISSERIKTSLELQKISRAHRILSVSILTSLLEMPDMSCEKSDLFRRILEYEQEIIRLARDEEAFAYSNQKALDIYRTVLKVALEDKDIDESEFVLLDKLREKLKISRLEHRKLEVLIEMYPKPNNELHNINDYKESVRDLQSKGILFHCNLAGEGNLLVLPEEIADPIKQILEYELREGSFRLLLRELSNNQLHDILNEFDLPLSGKKDDRIDRIIKAGILPSEALDVIDSRDLSDLCRKLKGLTVSGTKEEKIKRVINYFGSLSSKEPEEFEDSRAIYYQYYEELASRNNKELYSKKIIKRDRDIERFFEEATHYLFEEKLGVQLNDQDGNEHADGSVSMSNEEILLWDNKSKEKEYTFPRSHFKQFRRYIRESTKRVNVFLIIVSEVDKKAEITARQLKLESNTDTDVAIIRARDLKYVAENWPSYRSNSKQVFDLKVLNYTGILDRSILEQYMKIVL